MNTGATLESLLSTVEPFDHSMKNVNMEVSVKRYFCSRWRWATVIAVMLPSVWGHPSGKSPHSRLRGGGDLSSSSPQLSLQQQKERQLQGIFASTSYKVDLVLALFYVNDETAAQLETMDSLNNPVVADLCSVVFEQVSTQKRP